MVAYTAQDALARCYELARQNYDLERDKARIRAIMDGGAEGVRAVIAWNRNETGKEPKSLGEDLPGVNMMVSGVERLGQQIGLPPTLRMPHGPKDTDDMRLDAELRERVVESWDELSMLELQYPQIGRWLPGYGLFAWHVRWKIDKVTGQGYPHAELRDPFDTMTGWLGAVQQPVDLAFRRIVPLAALEQIYPRDDWEILGKRIAQKSGPDAMIYGTPRDRSWEGKRHGVAVLEYLCEYGTYVCVPEADAVIDYTPNQLSTGPSFVYGKRISFNRPVSHYHHIVGMVAMMAKFNVLALIAAEKQTLSETNIFGELEGNDYEEGHGGINHFAQNARVEKPGGGQDVAAAFAQLDRIERQLRIQAAYDPGSDSIAARGGFITGRGQEELRDPMRANVKEYHRILAIATQQLDTRRLEMDEVMDAQAKKRVFFLEGHKLLQEFYIPGVDIAGMWRSKRVYGMMAAWDEASKIVAGLQLMQGEVIDVEEFQDNLDQLDDAAQINIRVKRRKAERSLMIILEQQGAAGDPRAQMALTQIYNEPEKMSEILTKFYTPEEPEVAPEEQMMIQQGLPGEVPAEAPTVQTILSRLTGGGEAEGGVQSVGTNVA